MDIQQPAVQFMPYYPSFRSCNTCVFPRLGKIKRAERPSLTFLRLLRFFPRYTENILIVGTLQVQFLLFSLEIKISIAPQIRRPDCATFTSHRRGPNRGRRSSSGANTPSPPGAPTSGSPEAEPPTFQRQQKGGPPRTAFRPIGLPPHFPP